MSKVLKVGSLASNGWRSLNWRCRYGGALRSSWLDLLRAQIQVRAGASNRDDSLEVVLVCYLTLLCKVSGDRCVYWNDGYC